MKSHTLAKSLHKSFDGFFFVRNFPQSIYSLNFFVVIKKLDFIYVIFKLTQSCVILNMKHILLLGINFVAIKFYVFSVTIF